MRLTVRAWNCGVFEQADSLPLDFKTRYEKLLYHPTEGDVEDSAKGSHVRWGEWALIALLVSSQARTF